MSMNPELPEDVVAAIEGGRKIEAIKLLREQWNLDLKSAKVAVESYAAGRPGAAPKSVVSMDSSRRRLILILILFAIAVLVVRYLVGA